MFVTLCFLIDRRLAVASYIKVVEDKVLSDEQKKNVFISDVDGTITVFEGQVSFTQILLFHENSPFYKVKNEKIGSQVKAIIGEELYQAILVSALSKEPSKSLRFLKFDNIDASNLSDEHKLQLKEKLIRSDVVEQLKRIQTEGKGSLYIVTLSFKSTLEAVLKFAGLERGTHFNDCIDREAFSDKSRAFQAAKMLIEHNKLVHPLDTVKGCYSSDEEEEIEVTPPYIKLTILDDSERCINEITDEPTGLKSRVNWIDGDITILMPSANQVDEDIGGALKMQVDAIVAVTERSALVEHSMFSDVRRATTKVEDKDNQCGSGF